MARRKEVRVYGYPVGMTDSGRMENNMERDCLLMLKEKQSVVCGRMESLWNGSKLLENGIIFRNLMYRMKW